MNSPTSIDAYIADFPEKTQELLQQVRAVIKQAAPDAGEKIGYGIPTFTLNGNLVHFAGYKHHIGFYPGALGIEVFMDEISKYKWAKGSVQFPIEEPIPFDLITRIVKFRVKKNLERPVKKAKK